MGSNMASSPERWTHGGPGRTILRLTYHAVLASATICGVLEGVRGIAQIVVLLYVAGAMVVIGMTKVGGTMGAITKTSYEPDSHREISGWSRRTKTIHILIFAAACVVAFWP